MKVNGCCCFTLRTGGLICAWIWLIVSIHNVFDVKYWVEYFEPITYMVVAIHCLIGIYYDKHNYLLPFIIVQCIDVGYTIRVAIGNPIDWLGPRLMIHTFKYIIAKLDQKLQQSILNEGMGFIYIYFWIIFVIGAAIGIYSALVMYSLYKSMKTAARQSLPK
ncbi:uncharacterized protein LOC116338991 [Contarinia nasturtii]|uniref:uncharacterized protein LOC116338991 n=1 Tax=Contarinia nasturtii TaxID=265458 RepID=UPI0012D43F70|nr:uncharacterized protein LOC116338991 [Contarinia nasturtii]